ncbi:basic amino acid/polyamine antiporter [Paramicrobacterium sp. CJ85]|uniref:basic amino acid/polyamine antiporter n=1 Tax=Paramicrobacterium sp. CJ85 TaxID=3445355 RepID=UPI003F6166C2
MSATGPVSTSRRVPFLALAAMVVGSIVGAGVYSLPRNFAESTGVIGAALAWTVAGAGTLMLALVFQRLAHVRPHLDSGIYSYAKAGFGHYVGFVAAFGYWASACAGNATYWVLIGSTIGTIIPAFSGGNTAVWVVIASASVWVFHSLVLRGIREAVIVNVIVTIAKLLPIGMFLVIVSIVGFNADVFAANLWHGPPDLSALGDQMSSTMLITVFVFLGVEGASVYSRYAKSRRQIGGATVLGFLSVLAVFASVSILSYGVAPRDALAQMAQPSMAGVLREVVGPWGSALIDVGLIVSVLGAYLAWTLMASEVMFTAAANSDAPRFLARRNRHGVPSASLLLTTLMVQTLLVVTLFSTDAFDLMLKLCSSLSLVPYLFTAGYAVKICLAPERPGDRRPGPVVFSTLALVYAVFLLIAAGPTYLLLALIVFAPGTLLYLRARREQRLRVFCPAELALAALVIVGAIVGVIGLVTGAIVV